MTDLPVTMSGVWLTGHGDMGKLDIRQDIPVPVPGPREVLIRVVAAGVNNTDINTRLARYSKNEDSSEEASWAGKSVKFPLIQGADVCGHIVAVGREVKSDKTAHYDHYSQVPASHLKINLPIFTIIRRRKGYEYKHHSPGKRN